MRKFLSPKATGCSKLNGKIQMNDYHAPGSKILIVGCCGAGKTHLAKELAAKTGLPLVHLDREYYGPGWQRPSSDIWRQRVAELCEQPCWIMDGNYYSTLDLRLTRADTVIFMDMTRGVCLLRVLKRLLSFQRTRSDMAAGCRERWDRDFLKYVWRFHKDMRPRLLAALSDLDTNIIRLESRKAVAEFLNEV